MCAGISCHLLCPHKPKEAEDVTVPAKVTCLQVDYLYLHVCYWANVKAGLSVCHSEGTTTEIWVCNGGKSLHKHLLNFPVYLYIV